MDKSAEEEYTLSPDEWQWHMQNLQISAHHVANMLKKLNYQNKGEQDADEYINDITLALVAMDYVSKCASEMVVFISRDVGVKG